MFNYRCKYNWMFFLVYKYYRKKVNLLKYCANNIVCLQDGRTVFILEVDNSKKKYYVTDTEGEGSYFQIDEKDIFMFLT